jgi:hypothetical protein
MFQERESKLEQLLVAIATIALTGWAVVLGAGDNAVKIPPLYGIAFSAILGHGYSLVYGMLTAHDIIILGLEARLGRGAERPFLWYYQEAYGGAGSPTTWVWLYRVTALAIPVLAICAVLHLAGFIPYRNCVSRWITVSAVIALILVLSGIVVNERRLRGLIATVEELSRRN